MKYLPYTLIGLAVVALLYVKIFRNDQLESNASQQAQEPVSTAQSEWETKTDEQPPVTIAVTPIEFGENEALWKFDITLDTHSGSLDNDLLAIATLVDSQGNVYQPISWEGPGPGGHHREGVLIFEAINPLPPYVTLVIKDVGGVPERSFAWNTE